MSKPLRITPIKFAIHRQGDNPIFGEQVITIAIEDETGGPFFVVESNQASGDGLRIDDDELDMLVKASRRLKAEFERSTKEDTI
jgi:hypothetical protein